MGGPSPESRFVSLAADQQQRYPQSHPATRTGFTNGQSRVFAEFVTMRRDTPPLPLILFFFLHVQTENERENTKGNEISFC